MMRVGSKAPELRGAAFRIYWQFVRRVDELPRLWVSNELNDLLHAGWRTMAVISEELGDARG